MEDKENVQGTPSQAAEPAPSEVPAPSEDAPAQDVPVEDAPAGEPVSAVDGLPGEPSDGQPRA